MMILTKSLLVSNFDKKLVYGHTKVWAITNPWWVVCGRNMLCEISRWRTNINYRPPPEAPPSAIVRKVFVLQWIAPLSFHHAFSGTFIQYTSHLFNTPHIYSWPGETFIMAQWRLEISLRWIREKFRWKRKLDRHFRTHTSEKLCPRCNKYSGKCFLNKHLVLHCKIKDYKCTGCTEKFTQCTNMQKPMKNILLARRDRSYHPWIIMSQGTKGLV